jgi:excinuclease UvrABC nuclease subunit
VTIQGQRSQFNDENIAHAPKCSGVYVLYNGPRIIFIGKATGMSNLRSKLQSHKRGDEGNCTRHATHFCCELTPSTANRERDLLQEYKSVYGRLPACNEMMAGRYSF